MPKYNPAEIEPRWQRYWDENKTFATNVNATGPKLYALDMFPYPSGEGLHVGHPEGLHRNGHRFASCSDEWKDRFASDGV